MPFELFLPAQFFAFFLVFSRVGAALSMMPGLGEGLVSMRVRLAFAMLVSFLTVPLVQDTLPAMPPTAPQLALLVAGEVVIGLFIGTLSRIALTILEMAGFIISMQIGLASAQAFNPSLGAQGSVPGALMSTIGVLLILGTNLHHIFMLGVVDSYTVFTPGAPLPVQDFSMAVTRAVADGFRIALQIGAPLLVIGVLFQVSVGVLSRLMPQLQIFFIVLPFQLLLGVFLFSLILSASMMWFLRYYESVVMRMLAL
ncbi:flagellar biosynthetic protein FliR [Oceanibaculum nanhaiense]|uniref:flagellar biosynthetic protein FliR n=1 Tax=Oceanibaculum nanhaiense TaxID=1909734 RepID=UPI00396D8CDC